MTQHRSSIGRRAIEAAAPAQVREWAVVSAGILRRLDEVG